MIRKWAHRISPLGALFAGMVDRRGWGKKLTLRGYYTRTYRFLNGSAPLNLSRLIISLKNSRSLRSSSSALLRVPRTRHVNLGDRSFAKVAPSIWNQLPLAVRNAPSFPKFRSLLFRHLFD